MKKIAVIFLCLFLFRGISELNARLYFIHIPKTGGTTLRFLLEEQVSAEDLYPFRSEIEAKGQVKESLISGHFSYSFCKKMDMEFDEAFKVTILRDPVERYLSFLRFRKKIDIDCPDLDSVMNLRKSTTKEYHVGLRDNAICRNLAANPLLEGEELLESAKKTLQEFDYVIFFDQFEEDVVNLFSRLGIELKKGDIPRMNPTHKEPVSEKLLEEVRSLNALDMKLYEYAEMYFRNKNTTYLLRTKAYESLLQKTSEVDYTFNMPLNGRGWTYRDTINDSVLEFPFYRWVTDKPASIYFSLEEESDYDFYISAKPLTNEIFPRVSVSGKEIELSKMNEDSFSIYHGVIPKELVSSDLTEMRVFSDKTCSYRELYPARYNRNYPPLAFSVNRIRLIRKE